MKVRTSGIASLATVAYYISSFNFLARSHFYKIKMGIHGGESVLVLYKYPFAIRIAASLFVCIAYPFYHPISDRHHSSASASFEVYTVMGTRNVKLL